MNNKNIHFLDRIVESLIFKGKFFKKNLLTSSLTWCDRSTLNLSAIPRTSSVETHNGHFCTSLFLVSNILRVGFDMNPRSVTNEPLEVWRKKYRNGFHHGDPNYSPGQRRQRRVKTGGVCFELTTEPLKLSEAIRSGVGVLWVYSGCYGSFLSVVTVIFPVVTIILQLVTSKSSFPVTLLFKGQGRFCVCVQPWSSLFFLPDDYDGNVGVFDDVVTDGSQESFLEQTAPPSTHHDAEAVLLVRCLEDGLSGVLGGNRENGAVNL